MIRTESRRQHREIKNVEAVDLAAQGESVWKELEGWLESGMARLSNAEQDALLLRFFEGKSLREVGTLLGITDDAAQKRVNRALIRLRDFFATQGVAAPSALIAPLLASYAIHSPPISMASHLVAAVMVNAKPLAGVMGGLAKIITLAKAHAGIVAGTAGCITVAGLVLMAPALTPTQARNEAPEESSSKFALHGFVRDVAGKPLAGVSVQLATPKRSLRAYAPPPAPPAMVSVVPFKAATVKPPIGLFAITATNGEFTLFAPASPAEMKLAVFVTNEVGYALVTGAELAANPDIIVQPWARLEGVVRVGRSPATNQTVHIGTWGSESIYEWSLVSHSSSARTDANGKFVFAKVAPGDLWLTQFVEVRPRDRRESGHQFVHLEPGETVTVQLGGKGQPIVGKVECDSSAKLLFIGSMWAHAPAMRHPRNWNKMDAEERRVYERQWRSSPESLGFKEGVRNYGFAVRPDGTFRLDDVLPGKYRMQVRGETPGKKNAEQVAVGEIEVEVGEVPGGWTEEAFDVGVITAKASQ
jgi:hypothetical protein